MSSNSNSDSGPGQREIAYRLFAAEYDDATLDHSESDEERAPNYVVTPTGARANRLFAVGVLTEVESVNEDVLRARIADPTGAFVAYAGQYQPDAVAFLENTETPEFVALAGKARTFSPEDSDRIYTSVRPESVNAVDAGTRDRWVVSAAEATLRRVATFADALAMDQRGEELRDALMARGVDPSLASGISLAIDHYGTTTAYLEAVRRLAVDALEVVAGDREQVRSLDLAPGEGGEAELGPLPADASGVTAGTAPAATGGTAAESDPGATPEAEATGTESPDGTADPETAAESAAASETTETVESETAGASADADAETTAAATQMEEMAETDPTDTEAGTADAEPATVDDSTGTAESATTEPTESSDSGADAGGLGDFEDVGGSDEGTGDATPAADSDEAASTGVDETEMYEFDEEERQEIEEEFGTDFSTGAEVDAPGEADIETPSADAESGDAAEAADTESGTTETAAATQMEEMAETEPADTETDTAAAGATETETGTGAAAESESESAESAADADADADADAEAAAADVDLESAVVDAMEDVDEGDGADREAVVAAVVDEYGVDPGDAEDAIDDALMNGQCYEPAEGRLKAI